MNARLAQRQLSLILRSRVSGISKGEAGARPYPRPPRLSAISLSHAAE